MGMEMEIIPAMVIRIKWNLQGFNWKQNGIEIIFKMEISLLTQP